MNEIEQFPNLDEQHAYNYRYLTSLGYSYTNDVAVMSYQLLPKTNTTRITMANLAAMHNLSFSFSAPYQVAHEQFSQRVCEQVLKRLKYSCL